MIYITGILCALLASVTGTALPGPGSTFIYEIEKSKKGATRTLSTGYQEEGGIELSQLTPGKSEKILMSREYDVVRWEMKNEKKKLEIVALRKGNEIVIEGSKKGKPYGEVIQIDATPWFQAWEIGIDRLMLGNDTLTRFWSVNPDMLKAGLFTAVKAGKELIPVGGEEREAERVDISMKGFSTRLFRAVFWFEPGTGILLRSRYNIFGSESTEFLREVR